VDAAIAYGELLESAIDLHRFDLLRALHLPLPADSEAEQTLNAQLSDLLRQDLPMRVQYVHPSSAEPAKDDGPSHGRPPAPLPAPAMPAAPGGAEQGAGAD